MSVLNVQKRIEFSSCKTNKFILKAGVYDFEVVGASGGNTSLSIGGFGGRSFGILKINESIPIFVHIGEKGTTARESNSITEESCNGGGLARNTDCDAGSGGGSTDIRIGQDDVIYRVIVAGGGGGAGCGLDKETKQKGGDGGGLSGEDGQGSGAGRGGQDVWCSSVCLQGTNYCPNGTLLNGGNALTNIKSSGGGGGLIGGAASYSAYAAGGGSGYVFTHSARQDANITQLKKKYYLVNAITQRYNNVGNGYAVITPLVIYADFPDLCKFDSKIFRNIIMIFSLNLS